MTREEYLSKAMESISDGYIAEAASMHYGEKTAGREKNRVKAGRRKSVVAAAAACICLLAVLGAAVSRLGLWGAGEEPTGSGITVSEDGVTIPPLAVEETGEMQAGSMILFVVYEGGIYSQYEELAAALRGEYLGTSKGGIDEWSSPDAYGELSGSAAGELYAVNGYDPSFMVGLQMEDGRWMGLIRDNGITLKWGRELFEDRLHLTGRYTQVQWQSREDWYEGRGNEQTFSDSDREALDRFVQALCEAEFIRQEDILLPEGADNIYDSLEVCHLFFRMEDGLTVHLRCFAGGYVSFAGIQGVCVRIPADVFQAVCSAFSGE